jgi:hypothetical protein
LVVSPNKTVKGKNLISFSNLAQLRYDYANCTTFMVDIIFFGGLMIKRLNQFLVFMTVIAVIMTSAITTTTVYADDGDGGGVTSEPAGGGEEQPPVEAEEQEPVQEPAQDEPVEGEGQQPAPADEQPAVVEETPPAETVAEIIEQLPEDTNLIVLSEDGIEPLASQEAAQIIVEGDPIWCPAGQTTPTSGANGCTNSHTSFADLLAELEGGGYSGPGVIWVAGNYNSSLDGGPIVFNGETLTTLGDLEIRGGWSGTSGDNTIDDLTPSNLDDSLSIINWIGNVTLSNLNIDAEDAEDEEGAGAGLRVETSGNITLNNITSSGNSLGLGADLNTCLFDGAQCTGSGNVAVNNSTFNNNSGGSGIQVDSGGTIDLNTVQANGNDEAGAVLYNHDLLGSGGVDVTDSVFDANGDNGIFVYAQDDITLTNTDATNNGFDGADLINYEGTGDVTVNGGDFSGNDEAGLYIDSAGDVSVSSITSNGNRNGAVIFNENGSGNVNVSASNFDGNTWTGVEVTSAGNITLDDVDSSSNFVGGAYLNALGGSGNIFVLNGSQFNGNSQYGIHAFANGDITLDNVTVDGDLGTYDTQAGAWVKSFEGSVSVSNSLFTNNLDYGLLAVAAGTVELVNVTATFNGGDGVAVYSIYSFACFGNDNILINVDSGVYTDNGGYGIYAYPGEEGSLTLNNDPVFSPTENGKGDTFVEELSNPCPKPEKPEPSDDDDDKDTNDVEVPEGGTSGPVEQDCELFASTTFRLHSGTTVKLNCPYEGNGEVTDTPESELPDDLPVGLTFADAVTIGLDSEGNPITVLEDGLIDLTFKIPEDLMGKRLSILYWDPTAKDGAGDWIELPFDQFGGAYFPLYPDNPDDGRLLCSGFKQEGDTVTVTVNFPGTFVLVAR